MNYHASDLKEATLPKCHETQSYIAEHDMRRKQSANRPETERHTVLTCRVISPPPGGRSGSTLRRLLLRPPLQLRQQELGGPRVDERGGDGAVPDHPRHGHVPQGETGAAGRGVGHWAVIATSNNGDIVFQLAQV